VSVSTIERMRERLSALSPQRIDIADDSAKHVGHAGAQAGGGHYRLTIVSAAFIDKAAVARHRMIYGVLGDLMQHEIHALAIEAYSPDQF
jgi:BolA family transcriptional regulator, general stress-responsive regulator